MSTNKHARGPWTADYNCTTLVLDADGNEVAFVDDSDDARLIAASPCLLTALINAEAKLREQTRAIDSELGGCRSEEELEEQALWPLQVYEARAAIAKATQP